MSLGILRACRRRFTIARVMVVVYACAILGALPSPALIGRWCGVIASERFPCLDHSCGCGSAAECWDHCCCFTIRQKLMWYSLHRTAPPASASVAEVVMLGRALHNHAPVPGAHGAASHGVGCAAPSGHHADNGGGCVRADGVKCCDLPTVPFAAMSPLTCKSIATLVLTSVPPASTAPLRPLLGGGPPARLVINSPFSHACRDLDVPTPPPRRLRSWA